jgi:thymidylate synthase
MRQYTVLDIITEVFTTGKKCAPRGKLIKEIEYFQGIITDPWSNYEGRNFNLDYVKREFQWYLHADPYDTRICNYAKIWGKIVQDNGRILSNYGQYWFTYGIDWVVQTLTDDPNSRQAIIPMLSKEHLFTGNKDVVCSVGPQFRIVDGKLNIHVKFRSSDAIFGLGTDLPTYWWLWEMVSVKLNANRGIFVFSADSLHIYDYHFCMARDIIRCHNRKDVWCPQIEDADDLLSGKFQSMFGRWLIEAPL